MSGCRRLTDGEVWQVVTRLRSNYSPTYAAIFVLGVTTGLRISEMLALRLKDVLHQGEVHTSFYLERRHTKGHTAGRAIDVQPEAQEALGTQISHLAKRQRLDLRSYLFRSNRERNSPLGRRQVWRVIKSAFRDCKLPGKTGTHSMRKTFAHNYYDAMLDMQVNGAPVDPIRETMRALGHRDVSSTERYLEYRNRDENREVKRMLSRRLFGEKGDSSSKRSFFRRKPELRA